MTDPFRSPKGSYDPIPFADIDTRRRKLFEEIDRRLTNQLEALEDGRSERWGYDTSSIAAYTRSTARNREHWLAFLTEWQEDRCDLQPRVEHIRDYNAFRLDRVWLLVRKDIEMDCLLLTPHGNGKRPAIVCQHGLNGTPEEACGFVDDYKRSGYNACGIRLAEEGFVVIAPHEVGGFGKPEPGCRFIADEPESEQYRARTWLHRKAVILAVNLLGMELYHLSRAVDFLASLEAVDPDRMGFYGLSQGGQSALWFPAAETRMKATVCAAFFNHRMPKYVKHGGDKYTAYIDTWEEDKFYWGQMLEFSDWQIMSLICPRAFMVEAGKLDKAAYWEMANEEFQRGRQLYEDLGIGDRAEICIHDGGHINRCIESIAFLKKWLMA
ncbi:MAG: acetylxylan esterase [Planctomycetota bacterium]